MELISQNQTLINLFFCSGIVIFGSLTSGKRKDKLIPYITAAFALFGLSHLFTYLNMAAQYTDFLIIVRSLAYILVFWALFSLYKSKK